LGIEFAEDIAGEEGRVDDFDSIGPFATGAIEGQQGVKTEIAEV